MNAKAPSVALVSSSEERAAVVMLTERFLGLLERGWDAQLVFDGVGAAHHGACPELDTPEVTGRIHLSPAHRRGRRARWARRGAVARRLVDRPSASWTYMRADGRPGSLLLRGGYVESVLIALSPQVVHFDSASSAAGRLRVGHLLGSKSVVTLGLDDLTAEPDLDPAWSDADLLHFPSEPLRDRWTQMGSRDHSRGMVVAPSPDTDFFDPRQGRDGAAPTPSSEPTLRVVSVGTLSWAHGYEWALQAIRLLLESGVSCEYRIVGDGPHRDALSFARTELGLEDRVELAGAAGRDQLRQDLGWADVLLDATVVAGPPSSVSVAQAMALPVVASDRTDLSGAALDRRNGFIVRRRDPRGMAEKLAALANDPEGRRRMGAAARRGLLQHMDGEDQAAAYERLYRAALRG